MAELAVPPNKKSPGNVERPEEKASTVSSLTRGMKPLLLLSLLAIMSFKRDTAMISKYRHALDMDNDPRVGAPNSSDNDNDVVVAAAAVADVADVTDVAVGNHNSSSQNEQNETPSQGSLGSASVSASTTFRLPSSEWVRDIDTKILLGCGAFKCAFPSRTTSRGDDSSSSGSNDPYRLRYGYLVTNKFGLDYAERTFALAQELSETFAVKHTMLANPLAFGEGEANKSFFVQPIKLYSKQSIIFRCNSNLRHNYEPLEWAKKLQLHSALVDPIVFQERLQLDHNRTTEMMMYSNHSQCLAQDFQLVIDSITGSIFHIDIDRCFQKIRKSFKIKPKNVMNITDCMQELETITESMIARKKYLYLTIDSAESNHQNKTVATTKTGNKRKKREKRKKHKREIEQGKSGFVNHGLIDRINTASKILNSKGGVNNVPLN